MVFNHSSEEDPGFQPDLADFYNGKGFAFFMPYRHGQGISASHEKTTYTYIGDAESECEAKYPDDKTSMRRCKVKLYDEYNLDVVAALEWLKGPHRLSESGVNVDRSRVVMSGLSYGAVQTLLAAEKGLGLRACVAFSPASQSWGNKQLQSRLIDAVSRTRAPIFLIQARNDYSLGPSDVLGPLLRSKSSKGGTLDRAELYSEYGATEKDAGGVILDTEGHGLFALGTGGLAVWGPDVMDFIHQAII
jgi:dienelactone hydrolase